MGDRSLLEDGHRLLQEVAVTLLQVFTMYQAVNSMSLEELGLQSSQHE